MTGYYKRFSGNTVANMLRTTLKACLAVAALACFGSPLADDSEPPLYVAQSGTDSGNCRDAAAPCQTIDYALQRVGKNGQIRVAGGAYELEAVEDVVYMVSGAVDVRGGYRRSDSFGILTGETTTLVGVPPEFADALAHRGFHVIADRKGRKTAQFVDAQQSLKSNAQATQCSGGFAGVFPCNNVNLLAHVVGRTPTATGADIWGFIDLNTHREYAIVGYSVGTAVYDVTNPEDPREVSFFDGQRTTWRDIKIHQFWNASEQRFNAYAYVTADNASDGLLVLDLSTLPHSVTRIAYPSDFASAHNVYLTGIDFSTGLSLDGTTPSLILAGPNLSDGRFRRYSLANPAAPAFVVAPATPAGQPGSDRLYMHDTASMRVTDTRKDTQCVNATSEYCEVLFDFNETTLDVWDISNATNPVRLSRTPYANSGYTHSGWWTEDKQFVFVQDEIDERDRGLNTTLRAFSLADLAAPVLAGSWTGPTQAIDHNGFVRGNRYYMSNYARGLTILDISDPSSPATAGRFDTFPSSDNVGFPGAWGAYPFLPSGNLLISDIDSGLYVVEDGTLAVNEGSLSFTAASFGSEETSSPTIVVSRNGGSQGSVSVDWEVIPASASSDDVVTRTGTLSWGPGDSGNRVIDPGVVNDGAAEGLEQYLVKLMAPTGGATISSPSIASVYVSDPGDPSVLEFMSSAVSVPERGFATVVAVVNRTGSAAGAVAVELAVAGGDASATIDYTGPARQTLNWADGDAAPKWIEYAITDDGQGEADEFFELALENVSGAALGSQTLMRIDIVDGSGVNQAPNSIAGSSQTVSPGASVTLNGSQSNDPNGDSLTYAWSQTLGPGVTLENADTDTASFTAPAVSSDTLLRFQLEVVDAGGLADTAVVSVTVSTGSSTGGGFGGGGGGPLSVWLLASLAFAIAWPLLERMRLYDRLFAVRTR